MFTPLVPISLMSIYGGKPLPARMARCTPDTARAIRGVVDSLREIGFVLKFSDLYRSYEVQRKAWLDYRQGRKRAYSTPPGCGMHEAGRAFDIDLSTIGVPLSRFWEVAASQGITPVIESPDAARSEAWHFDCRGSHHLVYQYVKEGHAGVAMAPYTQMGISAVIACGGRSDLVPDTGIAWIQSALIRLGYDPGRIDGLVGGRTISALRSAGLPSGEQISSYVELISPILRERFPSEFE